MTQANVYNMEGKKVGTEKLPASLFGVEMNTKMMQDVVVAQNANSRQVLAHTKDRGEVRGGGKKPWRQKGTGRARQGSIRSPIWRGGGVTFGPTKDRNFAKGINKRMRRAALAMALTARAEAESIVLIKGMKLEGKTKQAASLVAAVAPKAHRVIMVLPEKNETTNRAMRNVAHVRMVLANSLNARDILAADTLVMPVEALKVITETYSK